MPPTLGCPWGVQSLVGLHPQWDLSSRVAGLLGSDFWIEASGLPLRVVGLLLRMLRWVCGSFSLCMWTFTWVSP